MLREAAAQAYGLVGEVIPSDVPGKPAMGVRQPAGVVVAIAPWTRRINFTGSTKAGRIIAEKAGRHLERVLLELGGKAPMIVLQDADLDRVAAAASFGAFFHQGQICMSTERIVVRPVCV